MNYINRSCYSRFRGIDYQKELLKYKRAIVALTSDKESRKKVHVKIKKIDFEDLFYDSYSSSLGLPKEEIQDGFGYISCEREVIDMSIDKNINIENKIAQLEKEPMITFQEEYGITEELDLFEQDKFLYHGIRFGNQLEVLEQILRDKKILAGKYIDGYYSFSDNCNDGEYVSLINYSDSTEFETFVRSNICFVISPLMDAYKTKYLSSEEWDYIKEHRIPVKNRYSYAKNEYQVKDEIPLEKVRAIGVSGISLLHMRLSKRNAEVNQYIQRIVDLLEKYSVDIPIVDIDCCNLELQYPHKEKVKNKH